MRQMRKRLFGSRIDHILAAAAVAAEPFAVNEKLEIGVHDVLTVSWGLAFPLAVGCR
jgi:hypothetical protein